MATVKPLVVDATTGNPREAKVPDTIDPTVLPATGITRPFVFFAS